MANDAPRFVPGRIYRMPTHFGPATGPRQGPDGRKFDEENKEWPKQTDWAVNFLSNADQLSALCPEGFSLAGEPVVTVSLTDMRGIPWLAGRGYKMLGVSFPEMQLEDMKPVPVDAVPEAPAVDPDVQLGLLHYKYIPRTGEWGTADVSYPVLTPAANPNVTVTEMFQGKGTVAFHEARWEDMPTQYMIVNAFAALEVKEYRGAVIRRYHGSKDLSDQRILR